MTRPERGATVRWIAARGAAGALVLALGPAVVGCGSEEAPGTAAGEADSAAEIRSPPGGGASATVPEGVRDSRGRTVSLDAPARRVVSLVPSTTELIVAMGGEDRLVARTRHDDQPGLEELPSLGTGLEPNLEALASLGPDLVVAQETSRIRSVVQPLESLGIPVYVAGTGGIDGLRRHARAVGELLGMAAEADSLVASIDGELEQVARRVEGAEPTEVLYILHPDPPFTTGSGTYLHQVIEAAGGTNVFADVEEEWPEVSMEAVVRRDPDVVVASRGHEDRGGDATWIREKPGWRSLSAVEEGRVLVVDPDLFNRPGPRVGEAARTLARFLHPDRFAGNDGS